MLLSYLFPRFKSVQSVPTVTFSMRCLPRCHQYFLFYSHHFHQFARRTFLYIRWDSCAADPRCRCFTETTHRREYLLTGGEKIRRTVPELQFYHANGKDLIVFRFVSFRDEHRGTRYSYIELFPSIETPSLGKIRRFPQKWVLRVGRT